MMQLMDLLFPVVDDIFQPCWGHHAAVCHPLTIQVEVIVRVD